MRIEEAIEKLQIIKERHGNIIILAEFNDGLNYFDVYKIKFIKDMFNGQFAVFCTEKDINLENPI